MAENLKIGKYNFGTSIPNVTDRTQWSNLTQGTWFNYNNNDSLGKVYGKLLQLVGDQTNYELE